MKAGKASLVIGLGLLSVPVSGMACQPIVPLIKSLGVTHYLMTVTLVILGVVVAAKSAAFARFQDKLSFAKGLLWMLAANVVTSIVGLTVPSMVESGGALFVAVPLVWLVCWLPAQRVIAGAPLSRLAKYTPGQLAGAITVVLVFSYFLFIMSRNMGDKGSFTAYWVVKLPALWIALMLGIAVTAFWEEWIVWRFSKAAEDDVSFVKPVVRANLVVLAAVVLVSTAVMIPKRWKGGDVVVKAAEQTKQQVVKTH